MSQLNLIKKIVKKIIQFPISTVGFISKDATMLLRKKKYMYLSLLLPLLIGIIYIFILTGSESNIELTICDLDETDVTKGALNTLTDFKTNRLEIDKTYDICVERITKDIKSKKSLFGILIPHGFTERLENLEQSKIEVYYDNSDPSVSSIAEWKIDVALEPFETEITKQFSKVIKDKSSEAKQGTELTIDFFETVNVKELNKFADTKTMKNLEKANQELETLSTMNSYFLANPIPTEKHGIYSQFKMLEIGIAPLFSILCMFIVLMLTSTSVIQDRKNNLIKRIRASNSTISSYILGKLIFFTMIVLIQFAAIMAIFFMFGAKFSITFTSLILAILFISLTDTLIGIIIGFISDNEGVAVLISLIITLPLLFMSGMFYPVEIMPKIMGIIARSLPLHTQITMMKEAMLFGGEIVMNKFIVPLVLFIISVFLINKK